MPIIIDTGSQIKTYEESKILDPKKLIDRLEKDNVSSACPDRNLDSLLYDLNHGYQLVETSYLKRLKILEEPGFVFFTRDKEDPEIIEFTEVPYGPRVREFILRNVSFLYLGINYN